MSAPRVVVFLGRFLHPCREDDLFFSWHRISNRHLDGEEQSSKGKERAEVGLAQAMPGHRVRVTWKEEVSRSGLSSNVDKIHIRQRNGHFRARADEPLMPCVSHSAFGKGSPYAFIDANSCLLRNLGVIRRASVSPIHWCKSVYVLRNVWHALKLPT
jgi:hypothetical protein